MVKIYIIYKNIINKQNRKRTLQYHTHQYFVLVLIKVITLNHLPFQKEN